MTFAIIELTDHLFLGCFERIGQACSNQFRIASCDKERVSTSFALLLIYHPDIPSLRRAHCWTAARQLQATQVSVNSTGDLTETTSNRKDQQAPHQDCRISILETKLIIMPVVIQRSDFYVSSSVLHPLVVGSQWREPRIIRCE